MPVGSALVVEHDEVVAAELVERLNRVGFAVDEPCFSGVTALERLTDAHPDLVLIDLHLPGDPGAMAAAKRIQTQLDIPVVFVSLLADSTRLAEARRVGAFGYLEKPFQDHSLLGVLEMALQRAAIERRLRKTARQWHATFDAVTDSICIMEPDSMIVHCNRATSNLLDIPSGSLIGKKCWQVMHGTDAPVPNCPVQRMRKSGRRESLELQRGNRWFSITVDPIKDADGNLTGAVHIMRDITEQRAADVECRRMQKQVDAAQKLESLVVVAGGIAHDFNNLLMGLLGYAQLALDRLPEKSSARSDIQEIVGITLRATELSKQMLAYSGRSTGRFMPFNLGALVRDTHTTLRAAIPKGVTLQYRLAAFMPDTNGDPAQVRQVLANLAGNAAEAIGDHGGTVAISTGNLFCDCAYLAGNRLPDPVEEGNYAYLEVGDDGCGMDSDTQERIFDPFFSTKFPGRGLGLSTVWGVMRAHKGAILIDSAPGRGTTFRVLFHTIPDDEP